MNFWQNETIQDSLTPKLAELLHSEVYLVSITVSINWNLKKANIERTKFGEFMNKRLQMSFYVPQLEIIFQLFIDKEELFFKWKLYYCCCLWLLSFAVVWKVEPMQTVDHDRYFKSLKILWRTCVFFKTNRNTWSEKHKPKQKSRWELAAMTSRVCYYERPNFCHKYSLYFNRFQLEFSNFPIFWCFCQEVPRRHTVKILNFDYFLLKTVALWQTWSLNFVQLELKFGIIVKESPWSHCGVTVK